jgi:signal transduction histidine kinase
LFVRATGPWPGDAIVWPAAAGAFGALLILRAPRAARGRPRSWAAHTPRHQPAGFEWPRTRVLWRPQVSRRGLGVALVLAAGLANLWASGEVRPAGEAVLAAVTVLIAAALIFAPSWRRLAANLQAEKDERIRSQERADLGAHLHDSVLQTLALIQRSADDPARVAALARQQERELRAWLAGEQGAHQAGEELGAALRRAASEVEAAAGGSLEVVVVGEHALDERGEAVLAAAREAMLNAAKFAGAHVISVYAELSGTAAQVYVRDRGEGFDPVAVPSERRGVRESIIGRMHRAGGRAAVRSLPAGGTEIEIAIGGRAGG